MVEISDLYSIAESMDKAMLDMNIKHREDFREDLLITLSLPKLDIMGIDQELYQKEFGTLVGYEPGDEVVVNVMGINFKLLKKDEAEN